MLELQKIYSNKEAVISALNGRITNAEELIEAAISKDNQRKTVQSKLDDLLAQQNAMAKNIGQYMKAGNKPEAEKLQSLVADLKSQSNTLKQEQNKVQEALTQILYSIPNVPNISVPVGKSESDNVIESSHGEIPILDDNSPAHWDICSKYKLIDFELGVKITGAGFPVYRGKGARLQRALIQFFLDEAANAGYEEIIPPHMVNEASGYGTGQLPDKEGQMYHVTEDDLYLIPTAEVPLTNMYRDVIVPENELQIGRAHV